MDFKFLLIISLLITLASLEEAPSGNHTVETSPPPKAHQFEDTATYPKKPLQSTILRQLFPYLEKSGMEKFVREFSALYSRHRNSWKEETNSEMWLTEHISDMLTNYTGSANYLRKIPYHEGSGESYQQENLIVRLDGHHSHLSHKIIILSAHYDTSGEEDTVARPGADDNASGCAVLMEVMRMFLKFEIKLKATLEFHFYSASDSQAGAADVVRRYKAEGKSKTVRGMLNFDSIGYQNGAEKNVGFVDSVSLGEERVSSPKLTDFVKMISKEYLEYKMKEADCKHQVSRCKSDYIAWHRERRPWVSVTEVVGTPHRDTDQDTIETVNIEQVAEFAKLGLAFAVELGELAETPYIPSMATKSEMGWVGIGITLIHLCFTIIH